MSEPNVPPSTPVKVVLWDLDGTVWRETLAETALLNEARLWVLPEIKQTMLWLDSVGVLQSIVSRNDHESAMTQLMANGLDHLFLHPEIHFDDTPKSVWVAQIAKQLNLGLADVVVIDDQRYERDQINHALPTTQVIDPVDLDAVLAGPRFRFPHVTDEDRHRRAMYLAGTHRERAQQDYQDQHGDYDLGDYLTGEQLRLVIAAATEDDLWRAATLTVRTHQQNATGTVYSHDELAALRADPRHWLLTARLSDRHGEYGTIGLALIEINPDYWHLRLLLTSCRVLSRRVGTILLHEIMTVAKQVGMTEMYADFIDIEHGRNRAMMAAYAVAGFEQDHVEGEIQVLRSDLSRIQRTPEWMTVTWT